ncbi:septum formation inhibitor Maf [uncultured Psychroserpens sp.]|uniref:septum formation inhibitor Maf n=1 Tax=uncultured Psychroserpens sp. TaxID=255436 RepID=UPI00262EDEE3|nr:septum formation inhibitor Maf [uncultured Psychroserpens sp.]
MTTLSPLKLTVLIILICLVSFFSCKKEASPQALNTTNLETKIENISKNNAFEPSITFKDYWYAGKAEITSYKLEQARYGELRNGNAVLVFVTEDFLPEKQVKADNYNKANIPVLKLNTTKNFNTGIYPYSIMQSTFFPVVNNQHALKVTCSVQEWCGHVYTQLNNRDKFEINTYSYFENEADQDFNLDKVILENELWIQLRIDPKSLPTGKIDIIPSFEFIRLKHVQLKAYKATAELIDSTYTITYPELNRTLVINYESAFPYHISSWEETYKDGYGTNAKVLTTKATRLKTINSAYWSKNNNSDEKLREVLELE